MEIILTDKDIEVGLEGIPKRELGVFDFAIPISMIHRADKIVYKSNGKIIKTFKSRTGE